MKEKIFVFQISSQEEAPFLWPCAIQENRSDPRQSSERREEKNKKEKNSFLLKTSK